MKVKRDQLCCLFGAGQTFKRLQTFDEEVRGLRHDPNSDAIHDVRVASRRLRTGLSVFEDCLPGGRAKRWRKELRRVTRALGQARDLDVQIEFVRGFLGKEGLKNDKPGLSRLLLRLTQKRKEMQSEVMAALGRLAKRDVAAELAQALARILARGERIQRVKDSPHLYARACSVVCARAEEMLAFEPQVLDHPERKDELHRMRIAAKHLRYAMEIFNPLYDDGLSSSIETAKEVQKTLGEIHDCDVWAEFLPRFLEDEANRAQEFMGHGQSVASLEPGLRHLQSERQRYRNRRYKEFAVFWKKERKTWDRLKAVLAAPPERAECASCVRMDTDEGEA